MSAEPFEVAGLNFMSSEDVPDDYGRFMIHGPQGSGKTTLIYRLNLVPPSPAFHGKLAFLRLV